MPIHSSQPPATRRSGGASISRPGRFAARLSGKFAAGVALFLVASICQADSNDIAVTDVRFWSLGDVTRVAVETTGPFKYTHDSLANPPRVFFDIHSATQRVSKETVHAIEVDDPLIEQIRVSQNRHTVTRVVLDLKSDVEIASSQLANPDRLMIEVRRKGAEGSLISGRHSTDSGREAARAAEPAPKSTASAPHASAKTIKKKTAPQLAPSAPKETAKTGAPVPPTRAAEPTPEVVEKSPDPQAPAAQQAANEAGKATQAPKHAANDAGKAPPASSLATPEIAKTAEQVPEPPAAESNKSEPEVELVAQPAKSNKAGGHSLTRVLGLKLGRVVIDPGHGGRDTGTIGPTGLREKDVTLDVAKRLAQLIREGMGSEVVLTRTEDESVPLSARTEKANEAQADLFVSIHVNSSRYRTVNGVETFYLNLTRSRADLEVAARENAGSDKSIHELTSLIQKIATDDKIQESQDLASSVHNAVYKLHRKYDAKARNRGVKKAPFVVLIGASMPSVLVELGFISNAREEKLMKTPEYRQELAEAMYEGISSYASSLSHFQVASAGAGE